MSYTLRFPDQPYPDLELAEGTALSEALDVKNSPLLFGCRTGLCGTCACVLRGAPEGPSEDEQEVLELYAEGVEGARLACQIRVRSDLTIEPLED